METEKANSQSDQVALPTLKVSFSYVGIVVSLACFCLPLVGYRFQWRESVFLALGSLAIFFSEVGNLLAKDYYSFRRAGGKDGRLVSDWIKPEPLVLKGAWGSYLMAFLFVLLISQSLGLAGMRIVGVSFLGFFTGYYAYSDPVYWNRSFLGKCVSSTSMTWLPFFSSCLIFNIEANYLLILVVFLFYVLVIVWRVLVDKSELPRYTAKPFPSYRYVPGKTSHPHRDPSGHSFGISEATSAKTQPEHWRKTELYLYGVDLFNAGYYWEAHEAWENLWKVLDPASDHANFLQGLIQLAAASLKYNLGNKEGVVRLFQQAVEKLMKIQKTYSDAYMGIDMDQLIPQVMKTFASIPYMKENDRFPKFRPIVLRLQK